MPETDPVKTKFEIDNSQVRQKFDEFERRMEQAEKKGRTAGKGGSAFFAAAVGGAAGFVAGAVANNQATAGVSDLLMSIIAATLLPIFEALMPAIEGLTKALIPLAEILGKLIAPVAEEVGDMLDIGADLLEGDFESAEKKALGMSDDFMGGLPSLTGQGFRADTPEEREAFRARANENPLVGWAVPDEPGAFKGSRAPNPYLDNLNRGPSYGPTMED